MSISSESRRRMTREWMLRAYFGEIGEDDAKNTRLIMVQFDEGCLAAELVVSIIGKLAAVGPTMRDYEVGAIEHRLGQALTLLGLEIN